MHILLTGSSGFLGNILCRALEEEGNKIIGLGRSSKTLNIDISKPFTLPSGLKIDFVIHAAGKAHSVPHTKEEKDSFFKVNYEGTKNLCNSINKLAVKPSSFVFISTVAVYGVDGGVNIDEKHPLNGDTPYARSKILAEQYLESWAKENNILLGILRLPLVAGPNPPGNLGAMINGIQSGKYLSIGKANARKSIIWGEDLSSLIPVLKTKGGTFNLSDGQHPSFRELETVICKTLNKKKPMTIPHLGAVLLAKIGDLFGGRFPINSNKLSKISSTLTFNDAKARKLLGWQPSSVLDKLSKSV